MFEKIRAWSAARQKRKVAKYAEDHAHIDPAELARVKQNFSYSGRRTHRRR